MYVDSSKPAASASLPIIIPIGFGFSFLNLASIDGLLFLDGAQTYADCTVTLFGHDAVNVRLDPYNKDYHTHIGPLKANVEFKTTSYEPPHGEIALHACYWALKWHCKSKTVISW